MSSFGPLVHILHWLAVIFTILSFVTSIAGVAYTPIILYITNAGVLTLLYSGAHIFNILEKLSLSKESNAQIRPGPGQAYSMIGAGPNVVMAYTLAGTWLFISILNALHYILATSFTFLGDVGKAIPTLGDIDVLGSVLPLNVATAGMMPMIFVWGRIAALVLTTLSLFTIAILSQMTRNEENPQQATSKGGAGGGARS